jgi:hypothetical protein
VCVTCATQKGLDIALQPKHSYALLPESPSATSQSDRTFHEDKLWGGSLPSLVMNQSCFLRLHVCISCLKTGCMSAQENLLQQDQGVTELNNCLCRRVREDTRREEWMCIGMQVAPLELGIAAMHWQCAICSMVCCPAHHPPPPCRCQEGSESEGCEQRPKAKAWDSSGLHALSPLLSQPRSQLLWGLCFPGGSLGLGVTLRPSQPAFLSHS